MGVTQVWQNEAKFFFLTNGPVLGGRLEKPAEEEAAARRYAPRVHRLAVAFWQTEPNPLNLSDNRVRLYEFDIQRNRAGH
jgi:hypothetical protein